MPYEWGRLSDVFDAGSRLRRISAWLVVRWGGAAFGFRAACIGESSLYVVHNLLY